MVTLEDWESTNIGTAYRGDTAEFQIQSTVVAEGSSACEGLDSSTSGQMLFSDGQATVIEHDKTYRTWVWADGNGWPGLAWFCQSASTSENDWSGYLLQLGEPSADDLRLWRADSGSYTSLNTILTTTETTTWYQLEITHGSDGIIEFAHLDSTGADIARGTYDTSTDGTVYSSGDFGFYSLHDKASTTYHDHLRSLSTTKTIAPPVAALSTGTPAPTPAAGPATLTPGAAPLTTGTPAPSVGTTLDAPPATLTTTTPAPAFSAGPATVSTRATALTASVRGIGLVAGYSLLPTPVATLSATAPSPTANGGATSLSPSAAALTTTTPAPSLASTATVAPPVTGLTTTSPVPTITVGYIIHTPVAGLTTTSPTPSFTGGPTTLLTPTTLLSVAAPSPSVASAKYVSPPVSTLTTTTPTPTTTIGASPVSPPSVGLSVTGAPMTFAVEGVTVAPPAAELTVQALAPDSVRIVGVLVQRADPIAATVAWEAEPVEATAAWVAEQIISDIHTD